MRILAIWSIRGYQKFLSPHKGFKCAHASFYGGKSCSSAVLEFFESRPFLEIPSNISKRFLECKEASIEINGGKRRKRRDGTDEEISCCFWGSWGMCWPE